MNHPKKELMEKIIEKGKKEEGVAALVVKDNEVISFSTGSVFSEPDATAHSEISVIREACKILDTIKLEDCWLYTTHEPCTMCAAAISWVEIEGLVYSAKKEDVPDKWGKTAWNETAKEVFQRTEHQPKLIEEYMRDRASEIGD